MPYFRAAFLFSFLRLASSCVSPSIGSSSESESPFGAIYSPVPGFAVNALELKCVPIC